MLESILFTPERVETTTGSEVFDPNWHLHLGLGSRAVSQWGKGVSERWNGGREGGPKKHSPLPGNNMQAGRQCCCCISGMVPATLEKDEFLWMKLRRFSYDLLKPCTPITVTVGQLPWENISIPGNVVCLR